MIADVYDQKSLEDMCSQAGVIINCVGPVSEGGTIGLKGSRGGGGGGGGGRERDL